MVGQTLTLHFTISDPSIDLHKPPQSIVDKIGYPRPIVQHEEARHRALRRFKNPGEA